MQHNFLTRHTPSGSMQVEVAADLVWTQKHLAHHASWEKKIGLALQEAAVMLKACFAPLAACLHARLKHQQR